MTVRIKGLILFIWKVCLVRLIFFYLTSLLFLYISVFPQMCITAISNLMQTSVKEGNPRLSFSKEKEIIPFIEAHWDGMTTTPRRVTQSWHMTVSFIIL